MRGRRATIAAATACCSSEIVGSRGSPSILTIYVGHWYCRICVLTHRLSISQNVVILTAKNAVVAVLVGTATI